MIVLDTHAWLWCVDEPTRLSNGAARAIADADEIAISSVCAWELALLVEYGRLAFAQSINRWVVEALASDVRFRPQPLDHDIAVRAAQLESIGFHGDPADRFLYATARALRAPLVTADRRMRAFDPANTVW